MPSITELYSSVYEKLNSIRIRYENAKSQLIVSKDMDEVARQKRVDNLKEQLEKIEEYKEKVEYFRLLAEKHLISKNLLAITPRELNFNRLRNWAMMIDPTEKDDPYAQRIYVQTKCNELFLQQKQEEFQKTLADLSGSGKQVDEELEASVAEIKSQLTDECKSVLEGEECSELAVCISERHASYQGQFDFHIQTEEENGNKRIGLGFYALSFPVLDELKYFAKAKLGDYFDNRGYILMPVEYPLDNEMLLSINAAAAKEKRLYRGLQNYILNLIRSESIGTRKIYFLDALHYNNTALGSLKVLEDSSVIDAIPRDSEAIVDKLKEIVSGFSDIDESLGMADSVQVFNATAPKESQIQRTVLVLVGYPSAFSGEAKNYIRRILLNYEHYGITPILVDTQYLEKKEDEQKDIPIDVVENVYRITMTQQRETISQDVGTEHHFKWYELTQELPEAFVSTVRSYDTRANLLGTEYINRVDMVNYPPYVRGKKSIVLPYGVDSKDVMHSISFDNENFALYLMGASGSGKSTLLHTLITGILRDYHPDDVELWLADFKMSEFAQYIDPLPPHVKYILLDESPELVYDLLDQLTEKMMERQRFFMSHRDMKKVENVPSSIYMPVIFVILDEFSIMSQAVSESEVYKLRLQNLLAKGRALGIKFIFSSQTFTKGIAGLTATAKDQIQTRIAMKNSYNEINETLELSSGIRTEQVKNWMEALPPHFALSKYRDGDSLFVKRLQVMYFKGKGDEALEPQRKLIRHIQSVMHPVAEDEYDSSVVDAYVDKKPVIVDGNSYKAFTEPRIVELIEEYKRGHLTDLSNDDVVVTFGAPRRMVNAKFATISNESRENLLLIARGAEQACGMSIILTTIKSFVLQGGEVQIWAYNKNRLYRAYKGTHFSNYQISEGMSEICDSISDIREKVGKREIGKTLVVLLGMEQICNDFDLIDFKSANDSDGYSGQAIKSAQFEAKTDEELSALNDVMALQERFKGRYDLEALEDRWLDEGKTLEEITAEEDRLFQEFVKQEGYDVEANDEADSEDVADDVIEVPVEEVEDNDHSYNASEDFKYIVRQGSRFGYHFMLCLNNLSDIKGTQLQQELFRHKLAFQLSADDSVAVFSSRIASKLPEHICQYSDTLDQYSLRPFIHSGVSWDGWDVDSNGEAVNSIL